MRSDRPAAAFIVLGLVFIAIGASRQRALVVIGILFLVVALVRTRQSRLLGPPPDHEPRTACMRSPADGS